MSERITEIKTRPRERVTIALSGGGSYTVPMEFVATLNVGDVLAPEVSERLSRVDQFLRGRDKAMRLLSLRGRSRWELRTALTGIGIRPEVRDGVLAQLEEDGLIDDRKFACEYVGARAQLKFLGPHRLRFELGKLHVARELIDDALVAVFPGDAQRDRAWELVTRKLGGELPGGRVEERVVRRMAGMLRRKGFDYEVVNEVIAGLLGR